MKARKFDHGIFLGFVGSPTDFFGLLFLPRPITHRHLKSGEPKLHMAISKGLLNNKNESDEKKVFVVRMFFT